ncbi:hypothetical protein MUN84_20270 [Hymenobacter sp. 5516J-16]|uniref:hypothetical protein n=1 Tax=Hymenobacter sp. 5516J-16 TaxID=2932253 RepID=UPI001FCFE70F|nr:hypothetical protein [Hymenobacter sp. 5516J-16]UOQ76810.1 hypothetical protein MUN84_20270 [Hymenobacter sp. 5516J-16]
MPQKNQVFQARFKQLFLVAAAEAAGHFALAGRCRTGYIQAQLLTNPGKPIN